jgi:hypothetical protein
VGGKSKESHNGFYDYSKVKADTRFEWVTIICPLHGDFQTKLEHHSRGSGNCPECVLSRKNKWSLSKMLLEEDYWRSRECSLYFIKIKTEFESFYKVGISSGFKKRFSLIMDELGSCEIEIMHQLSSNYIDSLKLEKLFKKEFKRFKYKPNQKFGGYTECFLFDETSLNTVSNFFAQAASQ